MLSRLLVWGIGLAEHMDRDDHYNQRAPNRAIQRPRYAIMWLECYLAVPFITTRILLLSFMFFFRNLLNSSRVIFLRISPRPV